MPKKAVQWFSFDRFFFLGRLNRALCCKSSPLQGCGLSASIAAAASRPAYYRKPYQTFRFQSNHSFITLISVLRLSFLTASVELSATGSVAPLLFSLIDIQILERLIKLTLSRIHLLIQSLQLTQTGFQRKDVSIGAP